MNKKTESFKGILKKSKFSKTSFNDIKKSGKEAGEAIKRI